MVNLLVTIVAIRPQKIVFHHIVASEMNLENCMKITLDLFLIIFFHSKNSLFPLIQSIQCLSLQFFRNYWKTYAVLHYITQQKVDIIWLKVCKQDLQELKYSRHL